MRRLNNEDLLQVWESGFHQHPLDRALTLLQIAWPDQSRQDLAQWPIGQRDGALLTLYEQTFGPSIAAQANCPACQERVEVNFSAREIQVVPPLGIDDIGCTVVDESGETLHFRLPNSLDLAAIADQRNPPLARRWLAERCLLASHADGDEEAQSQRPVLSEATLHSVSIQMAAADPQAEVCLALACPACHHAWQLPFDIVTFLWAKIESQARRLLQEVHSLAQAYGWREADILSLSAARRQFYLERVNA